MDKFYFNFFNEFQLNYFIFACLDLVIKFFSANFEANNTIQLGGKSEETSVEKINTSTSVDTNNSNLDETIEPIKPSASRKNGGMKLGSKKKDENRYY